MGSSCPGPTSTNPNMSPAAPATSGQGAPGAPARDPNAQPLKLSTAKFPDVTMGGVTAYTILVPEGWTAEDTARLAARCNRGFQQGCDNG